MNRFFIEVFGAVKQEELLPMIKQTGFDGFFSGPGYAGKLEKLNRFRMMGNELGLEYEASHSTISGCSDIWLDGSDGDIYMDKLLHEIDNCAVIHIPILVIHIQTDGKANTSLERGLKRLEPVVQSAKEKNVNIAFENVDESKYLCKVLEYFDDPHVGFCYDSGHEACFTPGVRFLPLVGQRLMCTHLNDNDGIADMHLLPFDGSVDFERICTELREIGYRGNLTFELGYSKDYAKRMTAQEFLESCYIRALRMREIING